jgi:hypothetical protein
MVIHTCLLDGNDHAKRVTRRGLALLGPEEKKSRDGQDVRNGISVTRFAQAIKD